MRLLARRSRTIRMCSLDARSEGHMGFRLGGESSEGKKGAEGGGDHTYKRAIKDAPLAGQK
jgi:hypothetical protein